MKKISLSLITLLLITSISFSQSPGIQWQQTMGTKYDDGFYKIINVSDGGYLIVGYKAVDSLNGNAWVVKKDASGITQWDKVFGGTGNDEAFNALQTSDGNFVIVGTNHSPETPGYHQVDTTVTGGYSDAWVFKLSATGSLIWQKLIGGKFNEIGYGVCEDVNGNIYVSGVTTSKDGDFLNKRKDSAAGNEDAFIVKLSAKGDLSLVKCYGGSRDESLLAASYDAGNIIAAGSTNSNNKDVSGLHHNPADTLRFATDIWYLKVDTNLNLLTQKCIGGTKDESAIRIKGLQNGNYGIVGVASSQDGDVVGHYPDSLNAEFIYDGWYIEVNKEGSLIKQKTIGGESMDLFYDFIEESSGSIVLCGIFFSETLFPGINYTISGWVVKIDVSGNIVWKYALGKTDENILLSIASVNNLGYYLVGQTYPYSGINSGLLGKYDGWFVKFGSINYITGKAFIDANTNSKYDTGEKYYSKLKVMAEKNSNSSGGFTGINGEYNISIDTGSYVIQPVNTNPYYNITPLSKNISHSTYFNTDTIDFALQPIANKKDLVVTMWPNSVARPGFDVSYKITYFNRGTTTIPTGLLKFKKDTRLNFVSATPVNTTTSGDTLIWNFSNFKPFDTTVITVNMKVASPPTANIGDTLMSIALLDPVTGDETPNDDTTTLSQVVRGSYDPNDKTELHGGKITAAQLSGKEYLIYLIRFQNTGTDTAFNIFVRDTLDAKLDWNSLEMLGSSHNYNLTIKDGNKLEWFFTNIKLVDSTTNEKASHGYIAYRIKPKTTLVEGDSVTNRASIYFDFNLPVNTNSNKTFIRSNIVTAIIDLNNKETQLYLYPNPASNLVMVTKEGRLKGNAILQIRDVTGRLLRQINYGNVSTESFRKPVDLKELPKGSYLLQLSIGKAIYTGKLIIQ